MTASLNLTWDSNTSFMALALQRTESTFEEIPVMSDFKISYVWGVLAENLCAFSLAVTFGMRVAKIQ